VNIGAGLLVDIVNPTVNVGNETAWHSGDDVPAPAERPAWPTSPSRPQKKGSPSWGPPERGTLRIHARAQIPGHYASVGGDHNPIHTNPIRPRRLFWFFRPSFGARNVLRLQRFLFWRTLRVQLPDAVQVFGAVSPKPVVLASGRAGPVVSTASSDGVATHHTALNVSKGDPPPHGPRVDVRFR